jgi:hypothetical protein
LNKDSQELKSCLSEYSGKTFRASSQRLAEVRKSMQA